MQGSSMTTTTHALINLTSSANGAVILFATDEWFAVADNLLSDRPPSFDPDAFCSQGKVMDGWETRRKRTPGHDWCIIALGGIISSDGKEKSVDGVPMMLDRIEFDTAYFTGNQTPRVSVEAMRVTRPVKRKIGNDDTDDNMDFLYNWMPGSVSRLARGGGIQGSAATTASQTDAALTSCTLVGKEMIEVLPMVPLKPGYDESRHHTFHLSDIARKNIEKVGGVTHLKLNYYPDGGVARMKVYGCPFQPRDNAVIKVKKDESNFTVSEEEMIPGRTVVNHDDASSSSSLVSLPSARSHPTPELSSECNGGVGLAQSNAHYGVSHNLLQPNLGINMGDGWETARHHNRPSRVERDVITGLQKTHLLDWAVLRLGLGGARNIDRIIVDTRHFKGNYPESVAIDGCYCTSDEEVVKAAPNNFDGGEEKEEGPSMMIVEWFPLLKRTRMMANAEHEYTTTSLSSSSSLLVNLDRAVTHIRVSVRPDGGLSRVRIYGTPLNALANPSKSKL